MHLDPRGIYGSSNTTGGPIARNTHGISRYDEHTVHPLLARDVIKNTFLHVVMQHSITPHRSCLCPEVGGGGGEG